VNSRQVIVNGGYNYNSTATRLYGSVALLLFCKYYWHIDFFAKSWQSWIVLRPSLSIETITSKQTVFWCPTFSLCVQIRTSKTLAKIWGGHPQR